MTAEGDRALVEAALSKLSTASETTPPAMRAATRAALERCREAIVSIPLAMPEAVMRSLLDGLVQRLASFTRAVGSPAFSAAVFDRLVLQWVDNVQTMWRRLHDDLGAIDRTFGLDPTTLRDAKTNLGDPHSGGHTVSRVDFADGRFLVYKPRPVHLERFFTTALEWLSAGDVRLEGLRVLDRDVYGWVLGVRPSPCESEEGIGRFHERLGALLAIAYTFGATDLHEDNLVANGEHPVLVDLETLVMPISAQRDDDDRLCYSVFDTGLLPAFLPEGPNGEPRLSGGIAGGLTDARPDDTPSQNLPRRADGRPVAPFSYRGDVLRGFSASWRRLCDGKVELLDLCDAMKAATYRFVLRPTHEYGRALAVALETTDAADVRAFRIALARALSLPTHLPDPRAVLGHELASLAALDTPIFVGTVAEHGVRAPGEPETVFEVEQSPWQVFRARLEAMKHEDEARHVARIAASFGAASESNADLAGKAASLPRAAAFGPLDAARAIAEHLEIASISTRAGGMDWIAARRCGAHWQLVRVEHGFASGRAGIAVFFAAMARCTGERRYGVIVARIFAGLISSRRRQGDEPDVSKTHALVRALTIASDLLEDVALRGEARAWAALLPTQSDHDRTRDSNDVAEHAWPALARVQATSSLGAMPAWTRDEIEVAGDHLCGGNAGLIDATLEMGRRLSDPSCVSRSRSRSAALLSRASTIAAYRLPIGPDCMQPGLFDGLAGIGYMWLRQVDPQLASLLAPEVTP